MEAQPETAAIVEEVYTRPNSQIYSLLNDGPLYPLPPFCRHLSTQPRRSTRRYRTGYLTPNMYVSYISLSLIYHFHLHGSLLSNYTSVSITPCLSPILPLPNRQMGSSWVHSTRLEAPLGQELLTVASHQDREAAVEPLSNLILCFPLFLCTT